MVLWGGCGFSTVEIGSLRRWIFSLLKGISMRFLCVVLLVCAGCGGLPKKELTTLELVAPKVVETEDKKERTRNITIQIMPIQNLTIKAI